MSDWTIGASVLTDGTFGNSLLATAVFVVLVLPVQTALGLCAASLLARQLPGSAFFRTVYVLPWVCRADRDRGGVALPAGSDRRSHQHAAGPSRGVAH